MAEVVVVAAVVVVAVMVAAVGQLDSWDCQGAPCQRRHAHPTFRQGCHCFACFEHTATACAAFQL